MCLGCVMCMVCLLMFSLMGEEVFLVGFIGLM